MGLVASGCRQGFDAHHARHSEDTPHKASHSTGIRRRVRLERSSIDRGSFGSPHAGRGTELHTARQSPTCGCCCPRDIAEAAATHGTSETCLGPLDFGSPPPSPLPRGSNRHSAMLKNCHRPSMFCFRRCDVEYRPGPSGLQ